MLCQSANAGTECSVKIFGSLSRHGILPEPKADVLCLKEIEKSACASIFGSAEGQNTATLDPETV